MAEPNATFLPLDISHTSLYPHQMTPLRQITYCMPSDARERRWQYILVACPPFALCLFWNAESVCVNAPRQICTHGWWGSKHLSRWRPSIHSCSISISLGGDIHLLWLFGRWINYDKAVFQINNMRFDTIIHGLLMRKHSCDGKQSYWWCKLARVVDGEAWRKKPTGQGVCCKLPTSLRVIFLWKL